ncbi:uncharacterized protein MELLADRAFT_33850, partial [Melampsora larici-populina 98AG31]
VKNILNRLRKEVVPTEELIRTTKIGISVGKQRQNPDHEISKLAKLIVNEWKNGVKKEPNHPTHSSTPTHLASGSQPQKSFTKRTGPRSSKTETHLKFESLQDKVRDGSMKSVFDALIFDSDAPADLVYERAKSIESEVNRTNDSNGYKNKMRSLIFNLKDKNNPGLREAVVSGEISSMKLCSMGPADMASEERKAQDRKLAEENLFKARGAGPQQAETDAFRCGRCGQRKCTYYQMQTRSADEPMTVSFEFFFYMTSFFGYYID